MKNRSITSVDSLVVDVAPAAWLPQRDEIIDFFRGQALGRYLSDWSLPTDGARELESDSLLSLIARPGAVVFRATTPSGPRRRLVGTLVAMRSAWDSDFWQLEYVAIDAIHVVAELADLREHVAEAMLEAFDEWCDIKAIRFAFSRVAALDLPVVHALERRHYVYIETTLENSLDVRNKTFTLPDGYVIRPSHTDETETLVEMTTDAFITHRFYADPGFSTERVDEMYRRWVRSSLGSPDWTTIVLDFDGVPKGFFIYRIEDHTDRLGVRVTKWRMGVLAGDSRASGHGIPLFQGAMDYVASESEIVDSGLSLRNLKSFNLHMKLGFRAIAFSATYHKWFDIAEVSDG